MILKMRQGVQGECLRIPEEAGYRAQHSPVQTSYQPVHRCTLCGLSWLVSRFVALLANIFLFSFFFRLYYSRPIPHSTFTFS